MDHILDWYLDQVGDDELEDQFDDETLFNWIMRELENEEIAL